MNILLVLVPISVVLLVVAIGAFVWAVRRGQFDNLDSAALDVLTDDRAPHRERDAHAGAAEADAGTDAGADASLADGARADTPSVPSGERKQRGD
jgi:cbb3-type cytochrome oxidase maturation protein